MDYFTIIVVFFAVSLFSSLVFFLFWIANKEKSSYLSIWLASFIVKPVGLLLLIIARSTPSMVLVFFGNMFIAFSGLLFTLAAYVLFQVKYSKIHYIIFTLLSIVFGYFAFIDINVDYRIVLISLIAGYNYTILLLVLSRDLASKVQKQFIRPLFYMSIAFIIVQIYRIVIVAVSGGNQLLNHTLLDTIGQLTNVTLNVSLLFALVILLYGINSKKLILSQFKTEKISIEKDIIEESEKKYKTLFEVLPVGMATHQLIYDSNHVPVNYKFLSANPAFYKHTGIEIPDVTNKMLSDIELEHDHKWLKLYANVCKNQKFINAFEYSEVLDKHFQITAYPIDIDKFAVLFSDVTQQVKEKEEKEYLLTHDLLTGLTSRLYFNQRINEINRKECIPITVINFDINGLIIINEAFGNEKGNDFILRVTKILNDVFGKKCVISRVGGDQFAVILSNTSYDAAAEFAKEVISRVKSVEINGVHLSLAYGIATQTKEDESADKLFILSENAMHSNKIFESQSFRNNSIKSMIKAYHEKNPREEEHSHRVSDMCEKFGIALAMTDEDINKLKAISYLHDIGKIAIDEAILNKPGKLTEEEWDIIKKHPEIGARIISTSDEYAVIADDILSHHERFDGKGYPFGIAGTNIPIRARMIAVIDSYDAMISDRPYRKAMSQKEAVEELYRCAGTQFDPELVDVFVKKVIKYAVD